MPASDLQVQNYVDQRIRPFCERLRAIQLEASDIRATIDDVYAALSSNPTWTDSREDGPAHLMTPADVLAINSVAENLKTYLAAETQMPVVLEACVRPVSS